MLAVHVLGLVIKIQLASSELRGPPRRTARAILTLYGGSGCLVNALSAPLLLLAI